MEVRTIKKLIYIIIPILILAIDQATKFLIRSNMSEGDEIPLIGNWLRLRYVQNTGTAFSMFSGNKLVTLVLASLLIILCLIFIIVELRRGTKHASVLAFITTLIATGGIGNMIDRISLGYVTDMISCGNFAIFNIADIFITCGCFAGMLYILYLMRIGEDF